jgi:hypothetical protein
MTQFRNLTKAVAAGALILACGAAQAAKLAPEEEIAKALQGREAGKPTNCIYQRDIDSAQIVDRTAILYKMRGGTIYLNRPASGAQSLDWNVILVTDTHSDQLCSIDIVKLIDQGTPHMFRGTVGLGAFVPYTKPKTQ